MYKVDLNSDLGESFGAYTIGLDNQHSPGGFDVIAHCRNCLSDYEWFCDKDGGVSDMKQYFFG